MTDPTTEAVARAIAQGLGDTPSGPGPSSQATEPANAVSSLRASVPIAPPGILHVYGQPFWHAALQVVGDRAGLLALRDAVDIALKRGAGMLGAMQNDGEGYWIEVVCASPEDAEKLPLAYTEEHAAPDDEPFPPRIYAALDALTAKQAHIDAQGIAARSGETEGLDPEGQSPVREADAP